MINISYNYSLFLTIFVLYWFGSAFVIFLNGIINYGKEKNRYWDLWNSLDGLIVMILIVIPLWW